MPTGHLQDTRFVLQSASCQGNTPWNPRYIRFNWLFQLNFYFSVNFLNGLFKSQPTFLVHFSKTVLPILSGASTFSINFLIFNWLFQWAFRFSVYFFSWFFYWGLYPCVRKFRHQKSRGSSRLNYFPYLYTHAIPYFLKIESRSSLLIFPAR